MVCRWPVDDTCLPDTKGDAALQLRLEYAIDLAQRVLWAMSGRQFGACTTVARPCVGLGGCLPPGRGHRSTCNAGAPSRVHLPGPVAKVLEVVIGGTVLDAAAYTVEGDYLYRAGGASWPGQDLGRALGEPGTWGVTYLQGNTPPPGVGAFVATLAKEFYNACTGGKCKLPRRVQTVSRQGVSFDMADPTDILSSGKTGFAEIDLWLASVNPNALADAPRVR